MPEPITEDLKGEIVTLVTEQRELSEKGISELDERVKAVDLKLGEKFQEVEDITAKNEALEKSQKEMDERMKELEVEVSLKNMSAQTGDKYIRTKCDDSFVSYMRKGDEVFSVGGLGGYDGYRDFAGKNADELADFLCKEQDPELRDQIKTSMVSGVNPQGGYFVPVGPMQLIDTKVFESSPMRQVSNIVTTATNEFNFILDDDEAASGWVGEVSSRGDTDTPLIGQIKIPVHEIFAQPKASQTNLDDAGFDVEGWLGRKVSNKFAREEATAFVAGDGSLRPKGYLDYAASADGNVYERNTVGRLVTDGNDVIAGDDLKGLKGLLKEDYQANAIWGMKRATWTTITKLKDTQNRYLFDMISNLRDGDIMQLLGQPVRLFNDMPDIADGTLPVVYADFREFYTIVDRMGIRVIRDNLTNKPFIKFYTTKRVGGAVTNYEAGKLLEIQ